MLKGNFFGTPLISIDNLPYKILQIQDILQFKFFESSVSNFYSGYDEIEDVYDLRSPLVTEIE